MSGHTGEDIKGRIKEAVGDITGDKALRHEGELDRASAATKKALDDVADKAKDIVAPKK